jgi:hypothetical protein
MMGRGGCLYSLYTGWIRVVVDGFSVGAGRYWMIFTAVFEVIRIMFVICFSICVCVANILARVVWFQVRTTSEIVRERASNTET